MRHEPQHVGYPDQSAGVVVGALLVGVLCCGVVGALFWCFMDYRRKTRVVHLWENLDWLPMTDGEADDLGVPIGSPQGLHDTTPISAVIMADCWAKVCLGLAFVAVMMIVTGVVLAILLFPTQPKYYICSRNSDWGSTFYNIWQHQSPEADYEVLMTMVNTNKFRFELHDVRATFLYDYPDAQNVTQQDKVGEWVPKDTIVVEESAMSDILMKVRFAPPVTDAYDIYTKFTADELYLDITLKGRIVVLLGSWRVFSIDLLTGIEHVKIGDMDVPKGICHCRNDKR